MTGSGEKLTTGLTTPDAGKLRWSGFVRERLGLLRAEEPADGSLKRVAQLARKNQRSQRNTSQCGENLIGLRPRR